MEYIKTFDHYNDDMIVEKLNLQPLLDKLKISVNKKNISLLIIGSLLSILTVTQTINFIQHKLNLRESEKTELINLTSKYMDPLTLKLSQQAWDHIRKVEDLRLTPYELGDGMVTIGYGHAVNSSTFKYKPGYKITKKMAEKLLISDVNIAAKAVKRMFNQWQEQGIYVKITQGQYDAMVSMVFNMGITKFRKTEFVQMLKKGRLKKAAELIQKTGISDKYPGLKVRRMSEYQMFIS